MSVDRLTHFPVNFLCRRLVSKYMRSLFIFLFITPLAACGAELSEIGARMQSVPCFRSEARCEIMIPNSDEPVVYDLKFMSMASPQDSLALADYLISWTVTAPGGRQTDGFVAYSGGDHFRYREGRLQEYHYADDPVPFRPADRVEKGVQNRAQFVDYLPQGIGALFQKMSADSSYIYNVKETSGRVVVEGVERVRGYDCREFSYTLDAATLLPVEIEIDANPGQPSEQTIVISYSGTACEGCQVPGEATLAAQYADAFGKFRRDNYSLEQLPGSRMPAFAAATPTRERFAYNQGEPMPLPTIIGVMDTRVASTPEVVESLREAAAGAPQAVRLILAFVDSDLEAIEAAAGNARADEVILVGARKLARDAGVADTPAVIFCGTDGKVTDVAVGNNNHLASDVIQKIAITR